MKSFGKEIKERRVTSFIAPEDGIFTLCISEIPEKTCIVRIDGSLVGRINYTYSFTYILKEGQSVGVYDIDEFVRHFNICFTALN